MHPSRVFYAWSTLTTRLVEDLDACSLWSLKSWRKVEIRTDSGRLTDLTDQTVLHDPHDRHGFCRLCGRLDPHDLC